MLTFVTQALTLAVIFIIFLDQRGHEMFVNLMYHDLYSLLSDVTR